jgi:hypothetical protein
MTLTLAQYRTRVRELLDDTSSARFTDAQIDAGLRLALGEYSTYRPRVLAYDTTTDGQYETVLPSAFGDLNPLTVYLVRFADPLDARVYETRWSTSRIADTWSIATCCPPPTGKEIQVIYGAVHTIATLDSGAASTVPVQDEELLAIGAAGFALHSRSSSRAESNNLSASTVKDLQAQAKEFLTSFRTALRPPPINDPGVARWQYP